MTEEYKYSINCGDDVNKLSKAVIYFGLNKLIEDENKSINAISTSRKYFKKHQIEYTLSYGHHIVEYYGSKIFVEYSKHGNPKPNMACRGDIKYYTEVIIKSNESEEKLKEFLDEAKQYYINTILDKEQEESKISIHMFDDYWDELHKHPKRSIDTIYLNDDLQNDILRDMKHFLSKETEDEYRKLGIPYKENYLFHGPPGTGKTSAIYSLASELDLDVCIFNFTPKTTDNCFIKAMSRLDGEDELLVLEDIDVLFNGRKKSGDSGMLTFKGFINALDGFGHQNKLITIMTTNHKCELDSALKRPGRIDKQYFFGYAKKDQVQKMYNVFLPHLSDQFDKFYDKIENKKVTTSTLQQYFFENRKNDNILKNIKDLYKYISESDSKGSTLTMFV